MSRRRKYQICLPEDLAEAVRARAGHGSFSRYVAESLEQRFAMDKLREIVDDSEAGNDELTRDEIDAARALLRYDHRSEYPSSGPSRSDSARVPDVAASTSVAQHLREPWVRATSSRPT